MDGTLADPPSDDISDASAHASDATDAISVSSGESATTLERGHPARDFMEFYSPPRIVPKCLRRGLVAQYSFDKATSGHNSLQSSCRDACLQLLHIYRPSLVMLSPPRTMFSQLNSWNHKKLSTMIYKQRLATAATHINYSMLIAQIQLRDGRYFCFEQPSKATSWALPSVASMESLPGVEKIKFDMCCFGMRSPKNGTPVRKPTTMMTNHPNIKAVLKDKTCKAKHKHREITGSEGGVSLSNWCQVYPAQLCDAIADSLVRSHR